MPNLSSLLLLAVAIFAGAVVPLQAGANANLGRLLGHPLWATVVSLGVSLALILPMLIAFRAPLPSLAVAFKGPWWIWVGGLAGVTTSLRLFSLRRSSARQASLSPSSPARWSFPC